MVTAWSARVHKQAGLPRERHPSRAGHSRRGAVGKKRGPEVPQRSGISGEKLLEQMICQAVCPKVTGQGEMWQGSPWKAKRPTEAEQSPPAGLSPPTVYGELNHRGDLTSCSTPEIHATVGARDKGQGRPQPQAHRSKVFILPLSRWASSRACLLSSCCRSKYFICF